LQLSGISGIFPVLADYNDGQRGKNVMLTHQQGGQVRRCVGMRRMSGSGGRGGVEANGGVGGG